MIEIILAVLFSLHARDYLRSVGVSPPTHTRTIECKGRGRRQKCRIVAALPDVVEVLTMDEAARWQKERAEAVRIARSRAGRRRQ